MTERLIEVTPNAYVWRPARKFDDFVQLCGCGQPHLNLMTDPDAFSMAQQSGRLGSVTLSHMVTNADMCLDCGQLAFKRHLGVSPMAYQREVRLHRAHQHESDPSSVTVASVAYRWGFTNLGRFAAAHAARYCAPPVKRCAVVPSLRAVRRTTS